MEQAQQATLNVQTASHRKLAEIASISPLVFFFSAHDEVKNPACSAQRSHLVFIAQFQSLARAGQMKTP